QELRWTAGPDPSCAFPVTLFTENETNTERLWGVPSYTSFVKDAFHRFLIDGRSEAINPANIGTKVAAHYRLEIAPRSSVTLKLRLWDPQIATGKIDARFDETFAVRIA